METVLISIGLLSGVFVLLHWLQRKLAQMSQLRRQRGLGAVKAGVNLMTCVQQHRGMSAALLSGDHSFKPRLLGMQDKIAQALNQVSDALTNAPEQGMARRRFLQIQQAWSQLQQQVQTLNPEQSFKQHTGLIRQVLYLLGDMGERAGLLEGHRLAQTQLAEVLLQRLPLLAESIGQARALGSASAAKGACGAVGRIRLAFLLQRIRTCQTQTDIAFDYPALTALATRCSEKVDALQMVISTRILGPDTIDLAPDAYFKMATDAIDACLALWQAAAGLVAEGDGMAMQT
ncbi:nitrate- and nitrite sensing domain-containing protein [Leeia oryzae]|uniref:nitrate- and nitrite sensing domain-containing protein n=1 Tax=Leeia oryzae TaxID=356662 RepID=UPI00035E3A7B|nr:nitrate- and nitrite sensing domain-containing protein [Leeia oryzae]